MKKQLVLVLFLASCEPNTNFGEMFVLIQKELSVQITTHYCLIIPFEGCSGCKSRALKFMEGNQSPKGITYILSAKQKKAIQFMVSRDLLRTKNIVIDANNRAHALGLVGDFPTLIYLKEGRVVEFKTLSATNISADLSHLEKRLKHMP